MWKGKTMETRKSVTCSGNNEDLKDYRECCTWERGRGGPRPKRTSFALLRSLDLLLLMKGLLRRNRDHSGSRGQVGPERTSGRKLTLSLCSSCADFGDALSLCIVTPDVPSSRSQRDHKP